CDGIIGLPERLAGTRTAGQCLVKGIVIGPKVVRKVRITPESARSKVAAVMSSVFLARLDAGATYEKVSLLRWKIRSYPTQLLSRPALFTEVPRSIQAGL